MDPRKLEVVWSIPGKLVAPTVDDQGVVVLRGDTLALVEFGSLVARETQNEAQARLRMTVESWNSRGLGSSTEKVGTWTYGVQEGDWLPDHAFGGPCFFHIVRILDSDRVKVEFPPHFIGHQSDAEITRVPTRFGTDSYDAGYFVTLEVVP